MQLFPKEMILNHWFQMVEWFNGFLTGVMCCCREVWKSCGCLVKSPSPPSAISIESPYLIDRRLEI